ncbi:SAM dependent carboxyl methyltransferase [Parasponia andersonii]|uniref:SAM dependent carboxyl methyltransferase n=1 Tax=Parasponia andersonii TaxID=3476 RepID=A0A2P5DEZ4_PARAD|nr:SAM dependent carboxyl methyltransferase [Parasponia andersonii]
MTMFSSSNTFRAADLGCATGPNILLAVQNMIDAVKHSHELPEFQVFFNDQTSNDFNLLFTSLPPERRYFAAGVPGSFRSQLFPRASLHFVHSSYAIQILSTLPKEAVDKSSPAWNKGRIHYSNSAPEAVDAYEAQFAVDMKSFLEPRAEEIVHDGLMAFIVPGHPTGTPHSEAFFNKTLEILGSCLVDMANMGKISYEKVDLFNLPAYLASPHEMEAAVKQNGSFSVEIMEYLHQEKQQPEALASTKRAGFEGILKEHFGFGEETLGRLYHLVCKKFGQQSSTFLESSGDAMNLFVFLKRI